MARANGIAERLETKTHEAEPVMASIVAMQDKSEDIVEQLRAENKILKSAIDIITKENIRLQRFAKVEEVAAPELGKDYYELVAVPKNGATPPAELVFNGKKCVKHIKDGFTHFNVPVKKAEEMLTSTSGMTFLLVSPKTPLKLKRVVNLQSVDTVILPHVLNKTTNGKPYWIPVEEEESKDVFD